VECSIDTGTPQFDPCSGEGGHGSAEPLADGDYVFRVRATDAAGNVAVATRGFTLDTAAPAVQVDSLSKSLLKAGETSELTWHANEDGEFALRVGGGDCESGTVVASGTYAGQPATHVSEVDASDLAEGDNALRLCVSDAAGNTGQATAAVAKDSTPPQTTVDGHPSGLANSATAEFRFSAADPGGSGVGSFQCRLDAGDWEGCASPARYAGLSEGDHEFQVRAIDEAGNVDPSPASFAWTVDTTPPSLQILSGPDGLTNDPTPGFTFSAEAGASLECSIDTGTPQFGPCSGEGGHGSAEPLADGDYVFRVRATDAAGNVAVATRGFTLDTAGPDAPVLSATLPASPANDNGPSVLGAAPADTTVRLYVGTCSGSPLATVAAAGLEAGVTVPVPDDSTTLFRATATTAAGNASGCSEPLAYVEDSTPPQTTVDGHPSGLANSATAEFRFSAADPGGSGVGSFQCRLDAGDWEGCASPARYAGLSEGDHEFQVRAIDAAGNVDDSPAVFGWRIDLTAPTVAIDSLSKSLLKAGQSSEVTWHANEDGSFELRVGGADCASGAVIASGEYDNQPATHVSEVGASDLAEGDNALRLCVSDAAGNTGQGAVAVVKDTTAPQTAISAHPDAATAASAATFAFSGDDGAGSGVASFKCRLDGASWIACGSPREYAGLGEGDHHFEVKAIDLAGNVDGTPDSFDWTVDMTPPAVEIRSGPIDLTNDPTPTFGFESEPGASFECSLDQGAPSFGACSDPTSHTPAEPLSDGSYAFRVRAADAAGNQAAAAREFAIDTGAPDTPELTAAVPASPANDNAPVVFGSAVAGATVELHDGDDCSSPPIAIVTPAELESGHTLSVPDDSVTVLHATATVEGRTSGCSEPLTYVEDSTAPETTIPTHPPTTTMSTSASFFPGPEEPGVSFECSLDGAAYAACGSPRSYANLTVGAHTFAARATDAAGNVDETPAEWSWAIEAPPTTAPSACGEGGGVEALTAAAIRAAVETGEDVCVTAAVGDVNLSDLGASPVTVSTEGGSMAAVDLDSTTDLTISRARFTSIELRHSDRTHLFDNTIGGTRSDRTYDQLIFAPEASEDVAIEGNDIGWTLADTSGNTGYGCRCYGDLDRLRFVGNRVHDIAADGFQGVGGTDVTIDRNEIGPVGRNPGSDEHSDNIQVTGNDANLRITGNWLHHQGYFEGAVSANSGSTYIHGGSDGSLVYENNLIETAQGRTEICGLGTGGDERSNLTIRRNTWIDGGLAFDNFPSFEWDCNSGTGNVVERNIAVDADGGLQMSGSPAAASFAANLWGEPSLVTLDASGDCTSANCNPAGQEPIGYRKPSGVSW